MPFFTPQPLIASHPKHLTATWAQQVINQHLADIQVQRVHINSIDIATTTRTRLTIEHTGGNSFPHQWFVKTPSLNLKARAITALPQLLHTETRFYKELAPIIPIPKPKTLSANSYLGRGSTLVLPDLSAEGYSLGQPGDALSAEQATLVIKQLADLHAKFWNQADTDPEYTWLAGPVRKLEDRLGTALAVPLMKLGLAKSKSVVPASLHKPAIHYARYRKRAMHFLSRDSQTIIHHDCHPGNLFWNQSRPGLLDWQMVRIGEGISDIAYFLATSLDPEIRRSNENQLLDYYVQQLSKHQNIKINTEQIKQRYRAHLIYPFEAMLITLAVGGMMHQETNLKLIARATSAAADNNTFSYFNNL